MVGPSKWPFNWSRPVRSNSFGMDLHNQCVNQSTIDDSRIQADTHPNSNGPMGIVGEHCGS